MVRIFNIYWDTEDEGTIYTAEELGLPAEIFLTWSEVADMEEDLFEDYLADTYGWCVYSCDSEIILY